MARVVDHQRRDSDRKRDHESDSLVRLTDHRLPGTDEVLGSFNTSRDQRLPSVPQDLGDRHDQVE